MQNYKVAISKPVGQEQPSMEFTAKDDLSASEIAEKFAKMHKASVYTLSRKARSHWLKICEDLVTK